MTELTHVNIQSMIVTVRGVQVMLDRNLAVIYGVETKVLNQAVKRNMERFPQEFRFQLTQSEDQQLATNWERLDLRSQVVTSSRHGGRRYLPIAFTEQGVSMLSAVLRSDTAVKVSIKIINAFVEMRRFIQNNAQVFTRLDSVEQRQLVFESETEKNFEKVFQALERQEEPPKQGIFYDGQVYDAYRFAAELIRKAKKSLVLIDNYVDDSVLTLLSKRSSAVSCTIYTKAISKQLALDMEKHNQQYPPVDIKSFKDLGKKWFAFSRFETGALEMLQKLEGKKHE